MATPQLKTTGAAPAPRRLLNTGAAPKKQVKLMGSNGQAIQPKKPALSTATVAATPKPAVESPAPVAAPAMEEDLQAKAAAEAAAAEAAEAAAAEEAARLAAEEEAARQAQAEYERQMEEYNRQMEEYNRQMEEYNRQQEAEAAAAEAAAAPVAEEAAPAPAPAVTPAPKPKAKLTAAKPAVKAGGANKLAAAKPKPKAKAAPAPASTEEGEATEAPDANEAAKIQAMQELAEAQQKRGLFGIPWLSVPVAGCIVGLAVIGAVCGSLIVKANAEAAAKQAHMDYTNKLLKRAQDINKQGIESIADAKSKGVAVVCSKEDAQYLLDVVVDPYVRDEKGKFVFGGNPEGVAQLACLLLGLASEQDPSIDALIFRNVNTHTVTLRNRKTGRAVTVNYPDMK
ncbi:MAG: hypothetical protein II349_03290, partial [Akkermansia sp.]|nr:hypothetical protein [Akkermansia sp.]